MPTQITPEYFVVMIDRPKLGREAVVDPQHTWANALELVREAASDGERVLFVHHIHDGVVEDRSEEAFAQVMTDLADEGETLTMNQREFIETHVSSVAANAFPLAPEDIAATRRDHSRDLMKHARAM